MPPCVVYTKMKHETQNGSIKPFIGIKSLLLPLTRFYISWWISSDHGRCPIIATLTAISTQISIFHNFNGTELLMSIYRRVGNIQHPPSFLLRMEKWSSSTRYRVFLWLYNAPTDRKIVIPFLVLAYGARDTVSIRPEIPSSAVASMILRRVTKNDTLWTGCLN